MSFFRWLGLNQPASTPAAETETVRKIAAALEGMEVRQQADHLLTEFRVHCRIRLGIVH